MDKILIIVVGIIFAGCITWLIIVARKEAEKLGKKVKNRK